MLKVICNSQGIKKTTEVFNLGGIIIFPTDTVYGIGCNPFNKESVEKIYQIKNRPKTKPFPVLIYSMKEATKIADFDEISMRLAEKFWPGPLTLIVKIKDKKIKENLELEDKVALRIPNDNCLIQLLKNCKYLIGTSANISGEKSFVNSEECFERMTNYDIFLDGGNLENRGESTIIEIREGKSIIHREGVLKEKEILENS